MTTRRVVLNIRLFFRNLWREKRPYSVEAFSLHPLYIGLHLLLQIFYIKFTIVKAIMVSVSFRSYPSCPSLKHVPQRQQSGEKYVAFHVKSRKHRCFQKSDNCSSPTRGSNISIAQDRNVQTRWAKVLESIVGVCTIRTGMTLIWIWPLYRTYDRPTDIKTARSEIFVKYSKKDSEKDELVDISTWPERAQKYHVYPYILFNSH